MHGSGRDRSTWYPLGRLGGVTRDARGTEAARWRLFVALPVPEAGAIAIHEALAAHRRRHPEARWLAPTLYHVTLRFLGPVDTAIVPALGEAVERCASDSAPFPVTVGRGGGASGRSEVAWLGLLAGHAQVIECADRLDALLPPELRSALRPTRPAPHVTIARRAPVSLAQALRGETLGAIRITWTADRVVLFRSHTGTPTGSSYEPIAEASLGSHGVA